MNWLKVIELLEYGLIVFNMLPQLLPDATKNNKMQQYQAKSGFGAEENETTPFGMKR